MPTNLIKKEKQLFELLKSIFINSNKIKLDSSQVPKGHRFNDIDIYYNEINPIWFIRSKIKDSEVYYFFGFKKSDKIDSSDIKPQIIIKFNEEEVKSNLRFNKKNDIYIMCKIENKNQQIINNLKKFKILKGKDSYYINLGNLDNQDISKNIEKLLSTFKFEITFNKKLNIIGLYSNELNDDDKNNSIFNYKNIDSTILLNINIMKLKEYLAEEYSSSTLLKDLDEYIFYTDNDGNYQINQSLFYEDITSLELLRIIHHTFENNQYSNLQEFIVDINVYIHKYLLNIDFPEDIEIFNSLNAHVDKPEVEVPVEVVEVPVDVKSKDLNNEWVCEDIDLNEEQEELFEEYLMLKDDDYIDYIASNYDITDNNKEIIFSKIKHDLSKGIIAEEDDPEDIIEEYFKVFSLSNNYNQIIEYYNNLINSTFYNNLLNEYNTLTEEDIEDIHSKIKLDLNSENLDEDSIKLRLEVYFKNKFNEMNYKNELKLTNKRLYQSKYNLTLEEISEVINDAISQVEDWYKNLSIFQKTSKDIFEQVLNEKLFSIKSEIRREFERRYNKESITVLLDIGTLNENVYDKLINKIYIDIDKLKIRYDDVNDDLIIKYYKRVV